MHYRTMDSPVGLLTLAGTGGDCGICGWSTRRTNLTVPAGNGTTTRSTMPSTQLQEYFSGVRREFDLDLDLVGTAFQQRVWEALRTIPYGETRSYGDIARQINAPGAFRAVGLANGHNPIGIIVPCHRVIGANGSLTGYGGGLNRKKMLLGMERNNAPAIPTLFD